MTIVALLGLGILTASAIAIITWMIRGSLTIADRVIALEVLLTTIGMGIAVYSILIRSGAFLDVLVVVSLLGFVGTVTVARFIERRGV